MGSPGPQASLGLTQTFWNVLSRDGPYPSFSAYLLTPGNKTPFFIFIWKMPAPETLLSCKVQRRPARREDEELIAFIQGWHRGSQTHSPFLFTLSPLGSALCIQSVYIKLKSKPVPGFGLKKKKDCPLPEAGWSLALQTELAVCRL